MSIVYLLNYVAQIPDPLGKSRTVSTISGFSKIENRSKWISASLIRTALKARRGGSRGRTERRGRNGWWRGGRLRGETEGGVRALLRGALSGQARDAPRPPNKGYEAGFPHRSRSGRTGEKPRLGTRTRCPRLAVVGVAGLGHFSRLRRAGPLLFTFAFPS